MAHPVCLPNVPVSAAQRAGKWSVPRMRAMLLDNVSVRPQGTLPFSESSSWVEKSTRKLAQHAPQEVQIVMGGLWQRSRCAPSHPHA
jgi:hypothetical protein